MSMIAVGSLHGAPGATTLAVGLATAIPDAVLVEADAAGGVIAARCGLAREPGLVTLAAERDAVGSQSLRRHGQLVDSGLTVVPCPESAEHATMLLRTAGHDLATRVAASGPTVVDIGRLGVDLVAAPFLERAVALVIVTHPTVDALAVLAARLPSLATQRPLIALVGDQPYGPAEVAAELGVDVVAVIASDQRAAADLWCGGGRRRWRERSAWARSVRALAADLDLGDSDRALVTR